MGSAIYNHLIVRECSVQEIDQSDGAYNEVIAILRCSYPFEYSYKQARGETSYDFTPMVVFSQIPDIEIKENMRMVYPEGGDFRIHSVNQWPAVAAEYLEIILQRAGTE